MTSFWYLFTGIVATLIVTRICASPLLQHELSLDTDDDEDDSVEDQKQLNRRRNKYANRLGLENFSSAAIADKAAGAVVSYLLGQKTTPSSTNRRRLQYRKSPQQISTTTERVRTLPTEIMMMMMNVSGPMVDFRFPDEFRQTLNETELESVINIEAAIQEALLVAQKMVMEQRAETSPLVLDELPTETPEPSLPALPPLSSEVPPVKKRRTRRSTRKPGEVTTKNPNDPLGFYSLLDWTKGFLHMDEGNAVGWAWKNAMRLAKTPQVQHAVDVVECQVFYNCDVSNELGTYVGG